MASGRYVRESKALFKIAGYGDSARVAVTEVDRGESSGGERMPALHALAAFLAALTNADADGRVIVDGAAGTLRFVLLNAAAHFSKARCWRRGDTALYAANCHDTGQPWPLIMQLGRWHDGQGRHCRRRVPELQYPKRKLVTPRQPCASMRVCSYSVSGCMYRLLDRNFISECCTQPAR